MDGLSEALDSAIASQGSAELAVIYLMDKYDFDLDELKAQIEDKALNVSFSNVRYKNIAHFFLDAPLFDIDRARIPPELFKEIVEQIQSNMQEYGPPSEHKNEEARSRYLAPAIWHFKLLMKNTPESIIPGHMMTKGQIEHHYKLFGGITIIFVEVKVKIGDAQERWNVIAQVIAESNVILACDYSNAHLGFDSFPIHGILTDGTSFEFFQFDGSTKPPTFAQGVRKAKMNQGICSFNTLTIPRLEGIDASKFILNLRPATEFIFWVILQAYISGIDAYLQRSTRKAKAEKKPCESTPGWINCLRLAKEVLQLTVDANSKAASGDFPSANAAANTAFHHLEDSINTVPKSHQRQEWNIMPAWDNEQMSNSW
ncbi:hypothetical protein L208DRAFT_1421318 [Tricholoma matsutake]|nr:hypothetical protein L208DRAFT_1421318 [Tricholoma matsutake 945]